MNTLSLLPCPFCGGSPGFDCWHQDFDFGDGDVRRKLFSMVRCLLCGAQVDLEVEAVDAKAENEVLLEIGFANASKKWNKRT